MVYAELCTESHCETLVACKENEIIQTENDFFVHHEEYYQVKGDAYYEGIWESVKNYISIRNKLQNVYAHGTPNEINAKYIEKWRQRIVLVFISEEVII